MRGDRMLATHHCRILAQRWLLDASRFFCFSFLCSVFLRLGRCVDSLYCSRDGMFLGVKFVSAPLPGASATCSSFWA